MKLYYLAILLAFLLTFEISLSTTFQTISSDLAKLLCNTSLGTGAHWLIAVHLVSSFFDSFDCLFSCVLLIELSYHVTPALYTPDMKELGVGEGAQRSGTRNPHRHEHAITRPWRAFDND